MNSCCVCWPWKKPGYFTMTHTQSRNQWNGDIAARLAPNNSECKYQLEMLWPRFFIIKTASFSLIIFQRAKLPTWSITHLCWWNWLTFWKKTLREFHQGNLVLARQSPASPGTCNPDETGLPDLPFSRSPTLFSGPDPVGLPPVLWTEKKRLKIRYFSSEVEVIFAA